MLRICSEGSWRALGAGLTAEGGVGGCTRTSEALQAAVRALAGPLCVVTDQHVSEQTTLG